MDIDRREKNWRQLRLFLVNLIEGWLTSADISSTKAIDMSVDYTDYLMEIIVLHTKRLGGEEIPLTVEEIDHRLNLRNGRRRG